MGVEIQGIIESGRAFYTPYGDSARVLHDVGLAEARGVFEHPGIKVWRTLPDRENATLDATLSDGRSIRLHIKRYPAPRGRVTPAEREALGARLLERAGIPTLPLVACGVLEDRRSFIITEDLYGYRPADKLIEAGTSFEALLEPTADIAARLHAANLHHRDLYLCHFFIRMDGTNALDVRLIDVARVRPLGWFARRWIVKDLAQFWYSTLSLPITDAQRTRWLDSYARKRALSESEIGRLRTLIERKVRSIARHDARLRRAQPKRNISISH